MSHRPTGLSSSERTGPRGAKWHSPAQNCACSLIGMTTGDELRRQRGGLRLTQRELARRVGVGLRTITSWEALGSRALPRTAEGRLAVIFGPSDSSRTRSLADVSDLELIAELARRLGATGIRVGGHPVGDVSHPIANDLTHRVRFATQPSVDEDYPSDASAQGITGTPNNDRPVHQTTASRRSPRSVGIQPHDGDPPKRRRSRRRP